MAQDTAPLMKAKTNMAICVVSAGQLVNSNVARTISALAEASGRSPYMIKALHVWDEYFKGSSSLISYMFGKSIIQAYKSGEYKQEGIDDTEIFLHDLVKYISPKSGSELVEAGDNMAVAKDCWNAMLFGRGNDADYVSRETSFINKITGIAHAVENSTSLTIPVYNKALGSTENKTFDELVFIVATDTNSAHFAQIEERLTQYLGSPEENGTYLGGHLIFENSFERGMLGRERLAAEGVKVALELHEDANAVDVLVCHNGMNTALMETEFSKLQPESSEAIGESVDMNFVNGNQDMFLNLITPVVAEVEYT
jgi:hypothetical protein